MRHVLCVIAICASCAACVSQENAAYYLSEQNRAIEIAKQHCKALGYDDVSIQKVDQNMRNSKGQLLTSVSPVCTALPFRLAARNVVPADKTQDQFKLDEPVCVGRARSESQSATVQNASLLKSDQRRIYKDCMEAKGYTIIPATD